MPETEYVPKHLRTEPTSSLSTSAMERLRVLRELNPWARGTTARVQSRYDILHMRHRDNPSTVTMEDVINTLDAEVQALIIVLLDLMEANHEEYLEVLGSQIQYLVDPESTL